MAKLDGVQTLDMQNGEITKIAYDGAEYTKVDGGAKAGDLLRVTTHLIMDADKGDYFEVEANGCYYDNDHDRRRPNYFGLKDNYVAYRKLAQPTKVSAPFAEMITSKVDAVERRVSALESAKVQPVERSTELTDGTRVKALRDGEFRNILGGSVGRITTIGTDFDDDDPFIIRVKSGISIDYFRPQDLEAHTVEQPKPTVGDIVVITGASKFESRGSVNSVGDIGKITGEGDGRRSFAVKVPGKSSTQNHTAKSEMRLATDAEKAEYVKAVVKASFKNGDYARVKSAAKGALFGFSSGDIVVIKDVNSVGTYDYEVRSKDGYKVGYINAVNLEKLNAEAVEQAEKAAAIAETFTKAGRKPDEYRKGDVVRYLGNSARKGSLAEVVEDAGARRVQIIMEPNRFAPKSTEYFESIEIVCFAEDRADMAKGGDNMKIVETTYTGNNWMTGEEDVDRCVEVALIDDEGKRLLRVSFSEGEPEDMTLGRDLNDAYSIADLVERAYDLGRKGVEVTFESTMEEY